MTQTAPYKRKIEIYSLSKIKFFVIAVLIIAFSATVYSQEESYVLKRGDVLSITVMAHPEFSIEKILVMPDGYVQFPGLGSLKASSMNIKDFTRQVTDSIGKYVVNPVVTVFVSMLQTQVINVIGYVNRPGQIAVFEPINIVAALSKAGGIINIKKCKKITLIHADQTIEIIKVKDLFSSKINPEKAKLLNVGDTLYVVEPNQVNWSQLSFFTTLGWIVVSVLSLLKVVK